MIARILGYSFVTLGTLLLGAVIVAHTPQSSVPLIFSPSQVLQSTWLTYKQSFLQPNTFRTVDTSRGDITTSEGQSYTMLKAVWMGDQKTFDGAWQWTKDNIQHRNDHLFSWIWGKRSDGSYGVLTSELGQNSASDADTDIALALLFAYSRWQNHSYIGDARGIINDIWEKEVVTVNGTPYLSADNVEKTSTSPYIIINPSYLHPAAYKIFARVDNSHPWNQLVDSSYALLQKSITAPLADSGAVVAPPNWMRMDRRSGALQSVPAPGDTNFGFDALRIPWRIALDAQWNNDDRAHTFLSQMSYLSQQWNAHDKLASVYSRTGEPVMAQESPAMYGGTIGYFMVGDPSLAKDVYDSKLLYLYNPGANTWRKPLSYYDDNWSWFGIGLYNHLLPNLTAQLPSTAFIQ